MERLEIFFSDAASFGVQNEPTLATHNIRSQLPPCAEEVGHKDAKPLVRPIDSNRCTQILANHLLLAGQWLRQSSNSHHRPHPDRFLDLFAAPFLGVPTMVIPHVSILSGAIGFLCCG